MGSTYRQRTAVGGYGEQIAARHLTEAGMEILDRNWRCELGEIDLVARDRDALVICEVKTRRGVGYGTPSEAVTARKVRRLRRLAVRWIEQSGRRAPEVRIDVVSVLLAARGSALVEHVRGVG